MIFEIYRRASSKISASLKVCESAERWPSQLDRRHAFSGSKGRLIISVGPAFHVPKPAYTSSIESVPTLPLPVHVHPDRLLSLNRLSFLPVAVFDALSSLTLL
jgi:hypothetical protein